MFCISRKIDYNILTVVWSKEETIQKNLHFIFSRHLPEEFALFQAIKLSLPLHLFIKAPYILQTIFYHSVFLPSELFKGSSLSPQYIFMCRVTKQKYNIKYWVEFKPTYS